MTLSREDVGSFLGLIVHDLRNPAATLTANIDFLREGTIDDTDAREALDDVSLALGELKQGLDQVSWVGKWLLDQPVMSNADGDILIALNQAIERSGTTNVEVITSLDQAPAKGGSSASRVLEILLADIRRHVRSGTIRASVKQESGRTIVELTDPGRAIAGELREAAFTLGGQHQLKGRADGRYGRFAGLLAAWIATSSVGGTLEACGEDGQATFRLSLESK